MRPFDEEHLKFLASLNKFGVNYVIIGGHEPDAIDILNYSPGLTFATVYQNSIRITQDAINIPIIDICDLIRNKEALNRAGEKAHLDKYDKKF